MRIVQMINSLCTGGAERLAVELHQRYLERGEDSAIISLSGDGREWIGERVFSLGLNSPYNPFVFPRLLAACSETGLDRADIIHIHLFPTQIIACFIRPLADLSVKIVTTEHNTHNRRRGTAVGRLTDSFLYRSYDRIVCVSKGVEAKLREWIPGIGNSTRVIYNGIDLALFSSDGHRKVSDDVLTIVSVGSISAQKNYFFALEVISELRRRGYGSVRYLIAGSGGLEAEIRETVEDLGLEDMVRLLGNVSDVPSLLRASDIFFMPSAWEGFGIAAVEAMACGLPVIASDVQGIREVVGSDGSCAILADPGSVRDMADALESLVTDIPKASEMSENAVERASGFSIERTVDEHLALYRELTGGETTWE